MTTAAVIPIAGWDVWLTVMERARYRCQCTRCPKHRKDPDGRCVTEQSEKSKLTSGPTNPGPDPARTIARVDVAELVAWCGPCWDHAVAYARRHRRQELREEQYANTDTLF